MADTSGGFDRPPDQGGGSLGSYSQVAAAGPGSSSTTPVKTGGGDGSTEVRMRSFAEILATERTNRNILEINLVSLTKTENNVVTRSKALTFDDLGELVFDVLNIDPSLCLGFNFSTGRYVTREIKFKQGVDISPYVRTSFEFKGHQVTTKKQLNNVTKVSFRNVPFNVPDEEIIQLCNCYGKPIKNKVHYEKMFNSKNKGMTGGTRWVEMELKPGIFMNNYYWLEGPLQGDIGSRITVLHNGQEQQCSHCLKTGRGGCKAIGNGKACKQLGNPRAKMSDYMAMLKRQVGYESLKSLYVQQFPSLQEENVSSMEDKDVDVEEEDELLPTNPIERKDAKIAELEKTAAQVASLQESVLKMKAEKSIAIKAASVFKNKIKFARKVTEERLKECLPIPGFENEHSGVLVTLMSTLVDEDSFELDPDTNTLNPKSDFLKNIEESIGQVSGDTEVAKQRFDNVRNKLVERVRETAARSKERRLSTSSVDSETRKRRMSSEPPSNREVVKSKTSPVQ